MSTNAPAWVVWFNSTACYDISQEDGQSLLIIWSVWKRSFVKPSLKKKHLTAVIFDFEKAYATIWKYGIMHDLNDFGLKRRLPNFLCPCWNQPLSLIFKFRTKGFRRAAFYLSLSYKLIMFYNYSKVGSGEWF